MCVVWKLRPAASFIGPLLDSKTRVDLASTRHIRFLESLSTAHVSSSHASAERISESPSAFLRARASPTPRAGIPLISHRSLVAAHRVSSLTPPLTRTVSDFQYSVPSQTSLLSGRAFDRPSSASATLGTRIRAETSLRGLLPAVKRERGPLRMVASAAEAGAAPDAAAATHNGAPGPPKALLSRRIEATDEPVIYQVYNSPSYCCGKPASPGYTCFSPCTVLF